MMRQYLQHRFGIFSQSSSLSGLFGAVGSVPNVCHSLCMTVVSALGILGITTNILPLMFLQTYQLYFWLAALLFSLASGYFYWRRPFKLARDSNVLIINGGLLIFGLPFAQLSDYTDFFRFVGGSAALTGILLLFFGRRLRQVYRSSGIDRIPATVLSNDQTIPPTATSSSIAMPKLSIQSWLFLLVLLGFGTNQYLLYKMNLLDTPASAQGTTMTVADGQKTTMKLTAFDITMARERMDKNNDGICDVCGMPIQQCIDSGQIDCNMANNPQAIGVLGTNHAHADLAVYVMGRKMQLASAATFMKSSFLHLDNNPNPADANAVLHQHAKNVPLSLFFQSIGMRLEKDSLTLPTGESFKNENGNTLKFYLNGNKVDELGNYSYQPLDKLLISYGSENDPVIASQISGVTDFAKDHRK